MGLTSLRWEIGKKAHAIIDDGHQYYQIFRFAFHLHPLLQTRQAHPPSHQARRRLPVPSLGVRNRALARPLQVARGAARSLAWSICPESLPRPPSSNPPPHRAATRQGPGSPFNRLTSFAIPKGPGPALIATLPATTFVTNAFLVKLSLSFRSSLNLLISRFCCRPSHPLPRASSGCIRLLYCHPLLTLTH